MLLLHPFSYDLQAEFGGQLNDPPQPESRVESRSRGHMISKKSLPPQ